MTKNKSAQDLRAIASEKRAQASRENGKKGGRPRGTTKQKMLKRKIMKKLAQTIKTQQIEFPTGSGCQNQDVHTASTA